MNDEQIAFQERYNSGTAWTRNDFFEKNGYLLIRNLWDPEKLYSEPPTERGLYNYYGGKTDQFNHEPVENQVEGSTARYWHPQYRRIHTGVRKKLEGHLGRLLYNTYYYDRFYYPGQELKKHADRDACEISVTIHCSTNIKGKSAKWPVWIKTPDIYTDEKKTKVLVSGENVSMILNPGDGMVYKGCERPHWREPLEPPKGKTKGEAYYHQIFFHYVLQDGYRAHCAWDRSR